MINEALKEAMANDSELLIRDRGHDAPDHELDILDESEEASDKLQELQQAKAADISPIRLSSEHRSKILTVSQRLRR